MRASIMPVIRSTRSFFSASSVSSAFAWPAPSACRSASDARMPRAFSSSLAICSSSCATYRVTRGNISAFTADMTRCTTVFSPQPMQAPSPPTMER